MEYTANTEQNFALAAKDAAAMIEALANSGDGLPEIVRTCQAQMPGRPALEVVAAFFATLGCEVAVNKRAITRVSYHKMDYANPTGMLRQTFEILAPFVPSGARLFFRESEGAREGWSDERYIFDDGQVKRITYTVTESW